MKHEPASYRQWRVKVFWTEAKAKASVNSAPEGNLKSLFIDPNPGDLTMSRMKLG